MFRILSSSKRVSNDFIQDWYNQITCFALRSKREFMSLLTLVYQEGQKHRYGAFDPLGTPYFSDIVYKI